MMAELRALGTDVSIVRHLPIGRIEDVHSDGWQLSLLYHHSQPCALAICLRFGESSTRNQFDTISYK